MASTKYELRERDDNNIPSSTTSKSCLNLQLIRKFRQYPIHSGIIVALSIIILVALITCITVFTKDRTSPTTLSLSTATTSSLSTLTTTTTTTTTTTVTMTTSTLTTQTTSSCNKFMRQMNYSTGAGSYPHSVSVVDIDQDGNIDIVVANK
ncbi:unnamed protein product, partial [Adineta ricciae]